MGDIPFNRPRLVGQEHSYVDKALAGGKLSGNGEFGLRCAGALEERLGAERILMVPSCTAALEMAGLLLELESGDAGRLNTKGRYGICVPARPR